MCDKAVHRCFFIFDSILNQYETQEMCGRIVSEDHFFIIYCPHKYKTQRLCDEKTFFCIVSRWKYTLL